MARAARLNVYVTPAGFYDAVVAAPNQKAALAAWGVQPPAPKRAKKIKWLFTLAGQPWFCLAGLWRPGAAGAARRLHPPDDRAWAGRGTLPRAAGGGAGARGVERLAGRARAQSGAAAVVGRCARGEPGRLGQSLTHSRTSKRPLSGKGSVAPGCRRKASGSDFIADDRSVSFRARSGCDHPTSRQPATSAFEGLGRVRSTGERLRQAGAGPAPPKSGPLGLPARAERRARPMPARRRRLLCRA